MLIKFTNNTIEEVNTDIAEALKLIGKKHGFDVKMSNLRYSEVSACMDIQIVLNNPEVKRKIAEKQEQEFNEGADIIGVPREWYLKEFEVEDITYTIIGIIPNTQSIVVETKTNEKYKLTKGFVERFIK